MKEKYENILLHDIFLLLRSLGVKFLGLSNSQRSVHFLEPEDNIIPIYMKCGMFCIDIHKPTEHELLTCTHVNLTDDMPWNHPEQVLLQTDKMNPNEYESLLHEVERSER